MSKTWGTKCISTKTGPMPKSSMAERWHISIRSCRRSFDQSDSTIILTYRSLRFVRSMKRIVFSLCYHFRTLKMENIVQLANILYNRRKHSSTGLPPYVCHNSAWAAGLLAKLNGVNYTHQQIQSMGFLARSKPRDILNIGSKVKIKLLKNIFNKFT